jgi:hypothetical protein
VEPIAEQDSQNFLIGYPLSQRRVEAGTTLLNKSKVKSRREGNRFQVVCEVTRGTVADVGIISGNCRPIINPSGGIDCLGKRRVRIEIGVFIVDAIQIYVALGATDMRKGFDGLYGLVRDKLGLEVTTGHLFLFANSKRLERGRFRLATAWGSIGSSDVES